MRSTPFRSLATICDLSVRSTTSASCSTDPMRRAMEQQNLALLIIRQVLLLRFSPLQRRMALEDNAAIQFAALLHTLADCMGNPANLLMCAGNDEHLAAWVRC